MPIEVPDNYPCSICENFNGTGAFQSVPHVHFHVIPKATDAPFPPTEEVPIIPSDERMVLAERVRAAWEQTDWN